ncbi:hypothetical protein HYH03_007988 [Edaphochlamys debaryana]|uniref:Uncharacterized protein n=1 Tax=Edaphochlamys debaryana TaxID=47281 RepID=A0A836BZB5_9CHLO|nr:hypothetical protein HYH03_007988 [Edaphochlamys debaryana]|eukprot:KAG2493767.1 hypothetical protein HYH03_007988 [Edaphochlamys debaryana]
MAASALTATLKVFVTLSAFLATPRVVSSLGYAWGTPGNVVATRIDLGPPQRCLPQPTPPNLDAPYDVYDQLLSNPISYIFVRSGPQPAFFWLGGLSLAGWNAIAPYDCGALPPIPTGIPRRPRAQRTQRNRNRALAAALLRFQDLSDPPGAGGPFAAIARQLLAASSPAGVFQLNPDCSGGKSKYNTPECVGIAAAEASYAFFQAAGYNVDGSRTRSFNKAAFEDYSNYVPKNSPWDLPFPCNYQPLHETDGRGKFMITYPNLSYLRSGVNFTLLNETERARTVPMWNCSDINTYKREVDEILAYSATLNDTTKTQAEFLGGGPWWLVAIAQLRAAKAWSTTDLMAFNLVQILQLDTMILFLKEKLFHDSVRPASAVRWLYGSSPVTAYGGPGVGTTSMPARDWVPYILTSHEAEYPSGTACWCRLFTEWLTLWQGGSTSISPPITFGWPQGCSLREPEVGPSADTFFSLGSMEQFRKTCQDARVIGGVHFRAGVTGGDQLCEGIAGGVWPKALALYPKLAGSKC